jgi:hypothetical protein
MGLGRSMADWRKSRPQHLTSRLIGSGLAIRARLLELFLGSAGTTEAGS